MACPTRSPRRPATALPLRMGVIGPKMRAYLDAGADSVVLFPTPVEDADAIVERAAAEVLPLLA